MPIRFPCDSCGKMLSVSEAHAGRRGACRHCGAVMRVPNLEEPDEDSGYALADPPSEASEPESPPPFAESVTTFRQSHRDPASQPRRRTTRMERVEEWKAIAGRVGLGLLMTAVVLGLVAAIAPRGPLIVGRLLAALGVAIYVYGSLTALYVAYTEEPLYAMLCVLFPPFALWYVVTRMDDLWHRLVIMTVGIAVLVVALWFLRMGLPRDGSVTADGMARVAAPQASEIVSGGTPRVVRA